LSQRDPLACRATALLGDLREFLAAKGVSTDQGEELGLLLRLSLLGAACDRVKAQEGVAS
jgi:hypothetical protein